MILATRFHSIQVGALACWQSRPSLTRRRLLAVANADDLPGSSCGASIVWYKNDLRVDDHPGLVAAASQQLTVVPLYVFDPRIISGLSDEMLDLLLFALEDLKKLLKDQGSDLFIGFGSSEDVIMKIVNEVKATEVFTEEDVDYNTRRVISIVVSRLSTTSFPWGSSKIRLWRAPFYDFKDMKGMPASYNTFLKLKLPVSNPTAAPTLPILNIRLERGDLPTIDDVKSYLNNESWTFMKKISAQDILQKKHHKEVVKKEDLIGGPNNVLKISSNVTAVHKLKKSNSLFASHNGSQVKGGTDAVLNALAGYLRYLEGTGRDDWQEVHDKMGMAESRNGASFGAIFGASLYFGTISRRRVHYEAIKYEKERNAGFLSPFGYSSPTVATAIETVCSMEWYRLLAYKSLYQNEGTCSIRIWRWRGFLIQYTVAGQEGPPVLFSHGFGAFLEHFRENISAMAESGHRVWGITLLGFGRSEKPNILYNEPMWAELLRDFIVDVVREPVHLVGNSIGGYFIAAAGAFWPSLAKSLVLINTAGSVGPNYLHMQLAEMASGDNPPRKLFALKFQLKKFIVTPSRATHPDEGEGPSVSPVVVPTSPPMCQQQSPSEQGQGPSDPPTVVPPYFPRRVLTTPLQIRYMPLHSIHITLHHHHRQQFHRLVLVLLTPTHITTPIRCSMNRVDHLDHQRLALAIMQLQQISVNTLSLMAITSILQGHLYI